MLKWLGHETGQTRRNRSSSLLDRLTVHRVEMREKGVTFVNLCEGRIVDEGRKKREKRLCKMIDAIVRYDRVRNIRNREEANEIDQRERDLLDRPSGIGCSFNDR